MAAKAMPREAIFALRETIARIEGKSIHEARMAADMSEMSAPVGSWEDEFQAGHESRLVFEDMLVDACRPGTMVEVRSLRLGEAGAASGLAMALALSRQPEENRSPRYLLIANPMASREAGLPYAPGLIEFGFGAGQLIHALPRRIEDALWLADAALSCRAFTAVMLEVHGNPNRFGLTESRRLGLKTRGTGGSLILIRQAGEEEASSASLRLLVEPAPAAARTLADGTMLGGSIGNSVFRVLAEKSRFPAASEFILEWNPHDRRLCTLPSPDPSTGAQPALGRAAHSRAALSPPGNGPARPAAVGAVLAFDRAS